MSANVNELARVEIAGALLSILRAFWATGYSWVIYIDSRREGLAITTSRSVERAKCSSRRCLVGAQPNRVRLTAASRQTGSRRWPLFRLEQLMQRAVRSRHNAARYNGVYGQNGDKSMFARFA